jgi:hypothetical protein
MRSPTYASVPSGRNDSLAVADTQTELEMRILVQCSVKTNEFFVISFLNAEGNFIPDNLR